jgi:lipopolysaccharide heptosyltransferase I
MPLMPAPEDDKRAKRILSAAPRRLLLVKLSSLGDVVHALPLLEALREGLGRDAFLAWAVRKSFAPLLVGNPRLSAVYTLEGRGFAPLFSLRHKFKKDGGFEAALDTQGLLLSGVVTALSGAPVRIGLDRNREGNAFFLTHPTVPAKHRAHIVDKLLGFCDASGLPRVRPRPQAYLADGEKAQAQELLSEAGDGPLIGFIVGASTADKVWPLERWTEAAKLLAHSGCRIVLLGGPQEQVAATKIERDAGGAVASNLAGKTSLPLLASVLAQCAAVVGGDSGPLHLAVSVGTPVVGLYGVTDPARTGPGWGSGPAVVLDYAEKGRPAGNAASAPQHIARCDSAHTGTSGGGCGPEDFERNGDSGMTSHQTAQPRRILAVNLNYLGGRPFHHARAFASAGAASVRVGGCSRRRTRRCYSLRRLRR